EQDALGRRQVDLAIQVVVDERQLDGIADLLDLGDQPADVGEIDGRDLFEQELVDLRLGHHLVGDGGLGVHEHRVTGAYGRTARLRAPPTQSGGQMDDLLLVVSQHDPGPSPVRQDVPEHRRHTGDRHPGAHLYHRHGLVEPHRGAGGQPRGLDAGGERQPHAPTGGHYLGGLVVDRVLQDDAVGARWGAETLDLTLERLELVPGVLEQLGGTEVPGAQGVDLDGLLAV